MRFSLHQSIFAKIRNQDMKAFRWNLFLGYAFRHLPVDSCRQRMSSLSLLCLEKTDCDYSRTRSLLHYLSTDVVEHAWHTLLEAIRAAGTVEEVCS